MRVVGATTMAMAMGRGRNVAHANLRGALVALCACFLLICSIALQGCKESDAIVERIYDQNSPNVDYDNPNKLYVPDKEAPEDRPEQELRVEEDTQREDDVEKDLPSRVNDNIEQPEEQPAPTTDYRLQSGTVNATAPSAREETGPERDDASGSAKKSDEAGKRDSKDESNSGSPKGDHSKNANQGGSKEQNPSDDPSDPGEPKPPSGPDDPQEPEPPDDPGEPEPEPPDDPGEPEPGPPVDEPENPDEPQEPEPPADEPEPPEDEPSTEPEVKPADPDDDTYLDRVYDSTYGDTEDLPTDVRTVAAVGELAVITQVLGNADTLVGSSEHYLGRASIQAVFSEKLKQAAAVWSGAGESTSEADAEAIIKAGPDACIVYAGQLSSEMERLIAQNRPDMKVITLPRPTSAANIEIEFKAIARLLSDATEGESERRAQSYFDFVSGVEKDAQDAHGGGVVTYASVDYGNTDVTRILKVSNPSSAQLWTLYVSGWDADAKATALFEGSVLFEDVGAAYTRIGWSWSPLSYYMSVGGIINNAAAYGPLSTQQLQPVLTLNQTQIAYTWQDFCVDVDESRGGGSFVLYRANYTLTNARDAVDRASASGFSRNDLHQLGSDDFNTVIVKTDGIKQALERARENENGLYTLYGLTSTGSTSAYGRRYTGTNGEGIIRSTVNGDAGYRIMVNPCGYVGSWTDGSIEAPLEALWVASEFWGYDKQKLRQRIEEFYDTFYDGYKPNVDEILKGTYAEGEES